MLIPYDHWEACRFPYGSESTYDNGAIVLIDPVRYFSWAQPAAQLSQQDLVLGENALVFYQTRNDWTTHPPDAAWSVATARKNPLGGQYVARISATTAEAGARISHGFTTTRSKGAGVRVYEYASGELLESCWLQLEALFWQCQDAVDVVVGLGMQPDKANQRKEAMLESAQVAGLMDAATLIAERITDRSGSPVCPLCLERMSAKGFATRLAQALGRETPDQTVTETSLFHIHELRVGQCNHRPYNVGWGHHHCNVVAKDDGVPKTLQWMQSVLDRNALASRLLDA